MTKDRSLTTVLERTSETIRESTKAKHRAWECLTTSADMVSQSRKLLSAWPVDGTPALSQGRRLWESALFPGEPIAADSRAAAVSQASESEAALQRVEAQTFTDGLVRLDGKHFVDCTIQNCLLEYWGGPVVLESTHFAGCRFSFEGQAAMTVAVLNCFSMLEQHQAPAPPPAVSAPKQRVN